MIYKFAFKNWKQFNDNIQTAKMFLLWIKWSFLWFVLYEGIGLQNVFCSWFYLSFLFLILSVFINILGLIFSIGRRKRKMWQTLSVDDMRQNANKVIERAFVLHCENWFLRLIIWHLTLKTWHVKPATLKQCTTYEIIWVSVSTFGALKANTLNSHIIICNGKKGSWFNLLYIESTYRIHVIWLLCTIHFCQPFELYFFSTLLGTVYNSVAW